MDALEDIYALCRRNNIQLVLYRAPTKRRTMPTGTD